MKQGDVYLRKEDGRMYAVAMFDVCLASGDAYEYQYNLYDKTLANQKG